MSGLFERIGHVRSVNIVLSRARYQLDENARSLRTILPTIIMHTICFFIPNVVALLLFLILSPSKPQVVVIDVCPCLLFTSLYWIQLQKHRLVLCRWLLRVWWCLFGCLFGDVWWMQTAKKMEKKIKEKFKVLKKSIVMVMYSCDKTF